MSLKLQIIAVAASLALLLFIFEMVRKKKLKENYSLTWFLVGTGFLLLSLAGNHLGGLAGFFGFTLVSNAIIVYAIFLLLILILGLSIAVTRISNLTQTLTQETALLKQRLEEQEKKDETKN